jgi:2-dehydro-3-deoxyphosphogluconate aldolase/(4S)-4-hydroxy-2-oxoglutarate aldolase
MMTALEALDSVLDHAPAIAVINAERADWGMHAASACVAAGFQVMAIGADTPSAPQIVASVAARPNMRVGLARVRRPEQATEAAGSGASFLISVSTNAEVGAVARDVGLPWIAGAWSPNEIESALLAGADMVQLYPIGSSGGPLHLRLMVDLFPSATFVVGGGVGGDRLAAYFEAGARAITLSEALYSRDLMAAGDHMTIRNHAAAAHRDAVQHGRVHGGRS